MAINTLVFDEDELIGFLASVARAKALERHVKLRWKDYDDSEVLNVIYTLMPWKGKPGTVEVDLGDQRQIESEIAADEEHLHEVFVDKASKGCEPIIRFLEAQEKIRESCLKTVRDVFEEAHTLSSGMIAEAQRAVTKLTAIKCASTITLKTAALAGGGIPAFLITTGYDLSLKFIKDWDQASDAKLIGIASKTGEKLIKKGIKDAAKNMAYIYKQEGAEPARKAERLQKRVAEAEEKLAGQVRADQLTKLARDSRRLARAEEAAGRARLGARVMTSVKFLFFAKDAYDALEDAHETIERQGSTGYGSIDQRFFN